MSAPVIMPAIGDTWWQREHQVRTPGPAGVVSAAPGGGAQASHTLGSGLQVPLGWHLPSLPDWTAEQSRWE